MSNDGGMKVEKLFRLWWDAFGDTQFTMVKLFGLFKNDQGSAPDSATQTFRQYLKDCGIFGVAGPETKFGIYLAKHLGLQGEYRLIRVRNVHQGAWQWSLQYTAPHSPTADQIAQAKCYVLVPHGTVRFSREASASHYEQKVRSLGYTADVIFHRQGGYAVRLFDVDRSHADSIARKVLLSLVEITSPLKCEGERTVIESDMDLPAIGYWPEQKFLDRAFAEDHTRLALSRPGAFLWKIFD